MTEDTSFTFGFDPAATALVTITVLPVNDPPEIEAPSAVQTDADTSFTFSTANGNAIIIRDVDAGADPLRVRLFSNHGTITLAGFPLPPGEGQGEGDDQGEGLTFLVGTGTQDRDITFTGMLTVLNAALDGLVFTPDPNFHGPAELMIEVNDLGHNGSGGPQTAGGIIDITVSPVNDAPVAEDDIYFVEKNGSLTVASPGVLANDWDVDGDLLFAFLIAGPMFGTLSFLVDGSFTYTPNKGFTGEDSFSYRASDGLAASQPAQVALRVMNKDEIPNPIVLMDTNRDGKVDDKDQKNKTKWEYGPNGQGAVILNNNDNSDKGQNTPGKDQIDNTNYFVDGEDDVKDLAPIVINRIKNFDDNKYEMVLSVTEADLKRVRIFPNMDDKKTRGNQVYVIGPKVPAQGNQPEAPAIAKWTVPAADLKAKDLLLGIEALQYDDKGMADPITLTLSLIDKGTGKTIVEDKVVMRVAPWIMTSNLQKAEKVYVAETLSDNKAFLENLGKIVKKNELEIISGKLQKSSIVIDGQEVDVAFESFPQDPFEFGYSQLPQDGNNRQTLTAALNVKDSMRRAPPARAGS